MAQHRARKRFGQNFLVDQGIINHIIRAISPKAEDNLVEIGPGQGALTGLLLSACPTLNVVELDRDLIPVLQNQFKDHHEFKIHQADALQFDFTQLIENKPLRVVGNLPYNISTPLIFHLLSYEQRIHDMHFMLQKEVVQRLTAKVGHKNYGRLGVMAQYRCQTEHLFDVGPESFDPAPKVESAIVRLTPYVEKPVTAHDENLLDKVVKLAFGQRRKTLRNALRSLVDESTMQGLEIDPTCRAETLNVDQYVKLANHLFSLQ